MDHTILLAMVRECLTKGRATVDPHVLTKHTIPEEFTIPQGKQAIYDGFILNDNLDARNSVLICGEVSDLQEDGRFIGRFIHAAVAIEWKKEAHLRIRTMYRPDKRYWIDERTTRPYEDEVVEVRV